MEIKYHRGVYGFIVNELQQIVLVKKSRGPYLGKLDLPGGRVEIGETDAQALVREVYEETGITVRTLEFFKEIEVIVDYRQDNVPKQLHHTISLWYVKEYEVDSVAVMLEDEDVAAVQWKDIKMLLFDDITPAVQVILEHFV